MSIFKIPHFGLAKQYANLKEELLEATDLAMKGGTLIGGEFTDQFEKWLAKRTNTNYATVVHSGTQALEFIARKVANYERLANDNSAPIVRIPNITYPATLNAYLNTGWRVELVDTDKDGIITDDGLERLPIEKYTCFVGLYGAASKKFDWHGRHVMVDGAQHWLAAGDNVGIAMAISFDPTKNLPSSGNGGAVVTDDVQLYESIVSMKNNGKLDYFEPGTNSKMSELECAHMMVRTKYIDEWQNRRRIIRYQYLRGFVDVPIRCLSKDFMTHADQKFVIYTDKRDALHAYLLDNGIETKVHYPYTLGQTPLSKHPNIISKPDMLSTSIHLISGLLSLPIYPEMTDDELAYIVEKVKQFYE